MAYSIAARMSRLEPSSETGLMPMALVPGNRMDWAPIWPWRKSTTRRTSSVPALYSIPA
jgi:hypothetical protein